MLPFTYAVDGRIISAGMPYGSFQQPFGPILPEITRLTGIDSMMVEDHMMDLSHIEEMVEAADLVIAHNASFDRSSLKTFALFSQKSRGLAR